MSECIEVLKLSENKIKYKNPPKRGVLEEVGNAVTHGLGSLFAVLALVLMLSASDGGVDVATAIIYSSGMLIAFTSSCLYHSFRYGSRVKRLFHRLDYLSIYLLIGATFAPILLSHIGGKLGFYFFCAQWVVIAVGVTLVGVFGIHKFRPLHFTLYFTLGWSGLVLIPHMLVSPVLFACVLGGGVIYTLGAIPFFLKGKAAHFIWHFFVLGGAVVQWLGIYMGIFLGI